MRLELLKYFLAVCKTGSINMTAQRLYISQQGLDSAIKRLEKELGVQLLSRSKTGVILTEEGLLLQKYSKDIIASYSEFEIELNKMKRQKKKMRNQLKVAINPLYSNIFTNFLKNDYVKNVSQIQYSVNEILNESIPKMVAENLYDIGIMSYNSWILDRENAMLKELPEKELQTYLLFEDELVVFMGRQNKLANKHELSDEDLINEQIILSNNTQFGKKSASYSDTEVLLDSSNFSLQQYYLTTRNCFSNLPYLVGSEAFDKTKITYCHFASRPSNKILLIVKKVPEEYEVEVTNFFEAFREYLEAAKQRN